MVELREMYKQDTNTFIHILFILLILFAKICIKTWNTNCFLLLFPWTLSFACLDWQQQKQTIFFKLCHPKNTRKGKQLSLLQAFSCSKLGQCNWALRVHTHCSFTDFYLTTSGQFVSSQISKDNLVIVLMPLLESTSDSMFDWCHSFKTLFSIPLPVMSK